MRKLWAVLAVVLAVGMMAAPAGAAKPSQSCRQALQLGDKLGIAAPEMQINVAAFAEEVGNNARENPSDPTAFVRRLTGALDILTDTAQETTDKYVKTYKKYKTAARHCRSGK